MTNGSRLVRSGWYGMVLAPAFFGACANGTANGKAPAAPAAPVTTTIVSGAAALTGFPEQPREVRVTRDGTVVTSSALAADGSFTLALPAGADYRLELVSEGAAYGLVLPRGHLVDGTFAVRGPREPFGLGILHYVGDPTRTTFEVRHADPSGSVPGCSGSGAHCIDDVEAALDTCGLETEPTTSVGCEHGEDVATGAPCGDAVVRPALPAQAMVAEHNVPANLGCSTSRIARVGE